MKRVLILGGTAEARRLTEILALRADLDAVVSLAGRTTRRSPQAVPARVGGFGGVDGLATYIEREGVRAVVDATHPYAAAMSRNAAVAAARTAVPLVALRRPPWNPAAGDRWTEANDAAEAAALLGAAPRRVFLALGRQEVRVFEAAPQHFYLVRSIEPIAPPLRVPRAEYRLDRGPFPVAAERELLERHRIEVIVAKNSGGADTYGKVAAARELGLHVLLLRRPELPPVPEVTRPEEVLEWLDHALALRGV